MNHHQDTSILSIDLYIKYINIYIPNVHVSKMKKRTVVEYHKINLYQNIISYTPRPLTTKLLYMLKKKKKDPDIHFINIIELLTRWAP